MDETHPPGSPDSPWYGGGLRFECQRSGNCCTGPAGHVWFDSAELEAMAAHLGMLPFQFLEGYAVRKNGRLSLAEVGPENRRDCAFLQRDPETGQAACRIHPVRPRQCRSWPFWPSRLASEAAWRKTARSCPGIGRGPEFPQEEIDRARGATPLGTEPLEQGPATE